MSRLKTVIPALVDQGFSSLITFGLLAAVARANLADDLGRFVLFQTFLIVAINGYRAVVGTAILVGHHSHDGRPVRQIRPRPVFVVSIGAGVLIGLIAAAVLSFIVDYSLQLLLACLTSFASAFALDGRRYLAYACERPRAAAAASATGIFPVAASFAMSIGRSWETTSMIFGLSFMVSAAALWVKPLIRDCGFSSGSFWSAIRESSRELGILFTISTSAQFVLPYALMPVGGLATVATVRTGQSIAGLGLQPAVGLQPLSLAASAKLRAQITETELLPPIRRWFVFLVGSSVGWCGIVYLIPRETGNLVFGSHWQTVLSVAWIFILSGMFAQGVAGVEMHYRIWGSAQVLIPIRVVGALVVVIGGVAGAYWGGLLYAALGLCAGNFIALLLSTGQLSRSLRRMTKVEAMQ